MYSFIELLRALAAMLITNSHFDGVYPWDISWGGCPGVALFFVISGFILVKSVQKEPFFLWWMKKVIRLYIPLSIVNFITVLIGYRTPSIELFLFPININLWYVPAIVVLYVLYYIVVCKWSEYRLLTIILALIIYTMSYMVRYRNDFFVEPEIRFRLLYGFIAMTLGSLIFEHRDNQKVKSRRAIWLFLGASSCGGFLFTKLLLNKISALMRFQFLTQVFGVAFAAFMLLAGLGYEKKIQTFMKTRIGKIVEVISGCSLEIYLVQFAIIGYLKNIVFPVNIVVIVITIVGIAYLINRLSGLAYRKVIKR